MNRLNKNITKKISLNDENNYDLEFWLSKSPVERIAAIETLRKLYLYKEKDGSTPRLQRIVRVIRKKQS